MKSLFEKYKTKEDERLFVNFIEKEFKDLNSEQVRGLKCSEFNNTFVLEYKPTNICNFACEYCCFHETEKEEKFDQTKIIKNFLKYLKKHLEFIGNFEKIYFFIYGGEPTLSKDLFKVIKLVSDFCKDNNLELKTLIQSNGVTSFYKKLSPLYMNFLKENNVVFSFSFHKNEILKRKKLKTFLHNARFLHENNLLQEITYMIEYNNLKDDINFIKKYFKDLPVYKRSILQESEKYLKEGLEKYLSNEDKDYELILEDRKINLAFEDLTMRNIFNFNNFYCLSGYTSMLVNTNGNIYRCDMDFLYNKNILFNVLKEIPEPKDILNLPRCSHTFCSIYFSDKYKDIKDINENTSINYFRE